MNKILVPKITFKDIISDGKRIEITYAWFFEIARRNILTKKHLTTGMSLKYTNIQHGRKVFDDRGGSPKVKGKQADSLSISQKGEDTSL